MRLTFGVSQQFIADTKEKCIVISRELVNHLRELSV